MLWVLIKTYIVGTHEYPQHTFLWWRGISDEYPQHMFLWRIVENYP